MGLIRRQTPYGEPARGGKRSLYKIDDPFLRLWFRVVAPNRAALTAGSRASRLAVLAPHWDALVAQAWEDLCRAAVPTLERGALARLGPWQPALRYWHGAEPEWDIIADAVQGRRVLAGEAWLSRKPVTPAALKATAVALTQRALPPLAAGREIVRALFVPRVAAGAARVVAGVHIVTQRDVI
jgi:uncharacterized protein